MLLSRENYLLILLAFVPYLLTMTIALLNMEGQLPFILIGLKCRPLFKEFLFYGFYFFGPGLLWLSYTQLIVFGGVLETIEEIYHLFFIVCIMWLEDRKRLFLGP